MRRPPHATELARLAQNFVAARDRVDLAGGLVGASIRASPAPSHTRSGGRRRIIRPRAARTTMDLRTDGCALYCGGIRRSGVPVLPGVFPGSQAMDRCEP